MRSRLSLIDISALIFILLWAYTAISKLQEFQETVVQLSQSPMIGSHASLVAVLLPIVELSLVVLLLIDKTKCLGLMLSLSLMTCFTTYIILMLSFSYHIPCSCGGIFSKGVVWGGRVVFKMSWEQHVVFNLCFMALGLANILFYQRANTVQSESPLKLQGA